MEMEELSVAFQAVTMCDSRAAAFRQLPSPVMVDYDEPAMGEETCTLRVRFPDGRILCKNFGAQRPAAALFRYCQSVLVGDTAEGRPFRLVRLAGGASDEIPHVNLSLQDLGLDHCTVHVFLV